MRHRERLPSLLCGLVGCRWEVRVGYDYCPRCGSASWHIAPTPPRRALLLRPLRWPLALAGAAFERVDRIEGSDLFADP